LSNCTGPTRLWLTVEGEGPKYERGTFVPVLAGAGNKSQPGSPRSRAPAPGPCAEFTPDELSATSAGAADFATERFARRCTAIASGDMGGRAATAACPKAAEGKRLLITVALAMTISLVEEKKRDRTAVTFRPFPEGEDPRKADIIVGLL
jgi:hypothetical protein